MTMMMNVARFEQEPEEQIDEATVGGADEDDLEILDEKDVAEDAEPEMGDD